jgi:hypothetical protein
MVRTTVLVILIDHLYQFSLNHRCVDDRADWMRHCAADMPFADKHRCDTADMGAAV